MGEVGAGQIARKAVRVHLSWLEICFRQRALAGWEASGSGIIGFCEPAPGGAGCVRVTATFGVCPSPGRGLVAGFAVTGWECFRCGSPVGAGDDGPASGGVLG